MEFLLQRVLRFFKIEIHFPSVFFHRLNFIYSSLCQIAPPQIAPSLQIAPVFRAGIVVQFGSDYCK